MSVFLFECSKREKRHTLETLFMRHVEELHDWGIGLNCGDVLELTGYKTGRYEVTELKWDFSNISIGVWAECVVTDIDETSKDYLRRFRFTFHVDRKFQKEDYCNEE